MPSSSPFIGQTADVGDGDLAHAIGQRSVTSRAPVRVFDLGGWTDTWFAHEGAVCNVAVYPGVEVTIRPRDGNPPGVRLLVDGVSSRPGEHPLLEAVLFDVGLPGGSWTIDVRSQVPAGAALGTSAAVSVALVAALHQVNDTVVSAEQLALEAHRIETGLGWQSGVQDQVAAAFGGVSSIEVNYPAFVRRQVAMSAELTAELNRRMLTVYLGRPHVSTVLHEMVIEHLERAHGSRSTEPAVALRSILDVARYGEANLRAGDLSRWAQALTQGTEAMRRLHPQLISEDADEVIRECHLHGAVGWKVNGGGGDGGTVSIVGPDDPQALIRLRGALSRHPWRLLDFEIASSGCTAQLDS